MVLYSSQSRVVKPVMTPVLGSSDWSGDRDFTDPNRPASETRAFLLNFPFSLKGIFTTISYEYRKYF